MNHHPLNGLEVSSVTSIHDIGAQAWDRLAGDQPFLSHGFFRALEDSQCLGEPTGWIPQYLQVKNAEGQLIGAAPAFIKNHSFGEYVFDHSWADALHRVGENYYPKLQIAVPFTPVPGLRLLIDPAADKEWVIGALLHGAIELCRAQALSSLHITFVDQPTWAECGKRGLLQRHDQQFHWHNRNYQSFDDFLAQLSARKRKQMKRERRESLIGLSFCQKTGDQITEQDWDQFFRFYLNTGARKWGQPYLNRQFFSELGKNLSEHVVLMFALRGDQPIAGSLHLRDQECLYGRYWGAIEDVPFLHFELCYYRAIDYAISHGLRRVEAGAQGAHKLARGFLPQPTYSVHWIKHPGLSAAVARYLQAEKEMVAQDIETLTSLGPFRKDTPTEEPDF